MVTNAEDDVVGLLHALGDPCDATHAEDEEMYSAILAEFPEERTQGMLRRPGGDVSKRALAEPRGVPETEGMGICVPSVRGRAGGDADDVVGGGCAV